MDNRHQHPRSLSYVGSSLWVDLQTFDLFLISLTSEFDLATSSGECLEILRPIATCSGAATSLAIQPLLASESRFRQRCAKIYCNIFPELFGILILEYPREVRILV